MTSLAFSTLLLLLLLIPGSIFINAYRSSLTFSANRRYLTFEEQLAKGLFYALVIHCILVCTIYWVNLEIDLTFILSLLTGGDIPAAHGDLKVYLTHFLTYFFGSCLFALVSGKILRLLFHHFRLHQRYAYLQMTNYWFEILSGEYFERRGVEGRQEDVDIILVDVLTENDVLYSGFLEDFSIKAKSDDLEYLVLRMAKKKKFKAEGGNEFREISGDAIVIPYSTVKNLNIYHLNLSNLQQVKIEEE